jgi:two-component system cell cycle sensor histidine kinase/response regulator CckA
VGRLAGTIAHDFNNLLTAIIGYGHLLYDEVKSGDPKKEMLEEILNAANRAAGLTSQLLSFSRKNPVKLEVLNLNSIVAEIEGMIDRLIGEDIEFLSCLEEKGLNVKVDATQLEQIVLNLIVNARDAMPRGGKLTVKTEKVVIGDEEMSKIPCSYAGDFACLSIIDTGVGMEKESILKIFEPFYTTKKTGTGLGLSVVNEIIKKLHGWINVESESGKGTTFKAFLPLSCEEKTIKDKKPVGILELQGDGALILVVEDEKITRNFIVKVLRENGYSVLETETIEEARKKFNVRENEIKMVFTDVVLSDGNGLEFAEDIISKNKEMRILLSSGYIDEKAKLSHIAQKKFRFLGKPYDVLKLLRAVKEALA